MRHVAGVLAGVLLASAAASGQPAAVTPAAEQTRSKLLKVQLTLNFSKMPLRDALKEIAHLVNENTERPIFWTYAVEGAVPNVPVTYNCKDKAVEQILDDLFRTRGLGFTVLSGDDHPRDGWVRVGPGKDRGGVTLLAVVASPEPEDPVEAQAQARLKAAKGFIDQGKTADARLILGVVTTRFAKTKAAAEAQDLLEKLNK
jgi:hypothetical protein